MKIAKDYAASHATVTLAAGEELNLAYLDAAIRHITADLANIWSIELILDARAMNDFVDVLRDRGFAVAGNVSEGNTTRVRMRKSLHHSGDGRVAFTNPDLAISPTPIPPSDAEQQAVSLIAGKYSDTQIAERLKRLSLQPESI